jgi:ABC-type microcin C transport system permease subunit YejE
LRFRSDRAALAGIAVISILVLLALTAPLIAKYIVHHDVGQRFAQEPNSMLNEFGLPKGPNAQFWFGADRVGRDLFVRVIYGIRTSLIIALLATTSAAGSTRRSHAGSTSCSRCRSCCSPSGSCPRALAHGRDVSAVWSNPGSPSSSS